MAIGVETAVCPDCGLRLEEEPWSTGLCPRCLLGLALTGSPAEAPTLELTSDSLSPGAVLGGRYQTRALLGRGGMGEVWRAHDLKLRVDVALKALRPQLLEQERAIEALRDEVRTAREVVSPNVCRVFDLVELDGQELVSMEYIDGITLAEVLKMRAPLDLGEAREIASQFLAGLEAIHQAGLVHRDVKPENLMMTRSGRVVVMDFGIAKGLAEASTGTVSGTPAYMAPEQARGEPLDARADVFAAGIVVAEMVAPEGLGSLEARQKLWRGVHHEPPEVPDTPWAPVVRQAVSHNREQRYASASALARALEEVTLRVEGAEDLRPYPGLASFSGEDAEYFFGRELEVEAMWKKLERPHLLALIGPSGSGKSSFLRAGLLPVMPTGWRSIVATPGNRPFADLARSLADEFAGEPNVVQEFLQFEEPDVAVSLFSRWRRQHDHVLVIVDQFEELFTLNSAKVQTRFAELLGRLALEADAHVLLSMRDDFLFHCAPQESLAPIFSEMSPLKPLSGSSLRRALVQPALKCGYRFEDESLVEEMVDEVADERGALPLLAFAAARLWEYRDREQGVLTRDAYEHIGGVAGALAQHAEATLERIGRDRIPVVRELFRNLVTAQGTRVAREREELLSVFGVGDTSDSHVGEGLVPSRVDVGEGLAPSRAGTSPAPTPERQSASEVLNTLIDARLLTSYDVPGAEDEDAGHRRIEIVHESLLTNWPRLVRWQTQDTEGAQLRDELRQAAQMWDQHERTEDLLWTGTAYREYQLWRERYPGGLSGTEEAFGDAMTTHAERRRRRQRLVVTAVIVAALVVTMIMATLWRQSEAAKQKAIAESRRAEAANLFSLAQLRLEDHPSAAIAYSIASLELADNPEVRRLVVDALWRGPTEIRLPSGSYYGLDFSPDGRWLATASEQGGGVLWPADGGAPTPLEGSDVAMEIRISPRGDLVAHTMDTERQTLGLWSLPEGRFLRSFSLGDKGLTFSFRFSRDGNRLITSTESLVGDRGQVKVRSWPVQGGEPKLLASLEIPNESLGSHVDVDPSGSRVAWVEGDILKIARLEGDRVDPASTIPLRHDEPVLLATFDDQGHHLASADAAGLIRIWSMNDNSPRVIRTFEHLSGGYKRIQFSPSGSMLAHSDKVLWRLSAPADAEPQQLQLVSGVSEAETVWGFGLAFDPTDSWLATGYPGSVSLWPLAKSYPQVLRGHDQWVMGLAFTPDSRYLVSNSFADGTVRVWNLASGVGERSRVLEKAVGLAQSPYRIAVAPDGSSVVSGSTIGRVAVLPFDGGPARELRGFGDVITAVAVGPGSHQVAAGSGAYEKSEAIVRLWNLETGEAQILDAGDGRTINHLEFTSGGLWVSSGQMLRLWAVDEPPPRLVDEVDLSSLLSSTGSVEEFRPDLRQALVCGQGRQSPGQLWIYDLDTHKVRELSSHGSMVATATFDPSGEAVVSVDKQGTVRAGPVTGEEPHLLLGHEGEVNGVAVSPDGEWIASSADDKEIRLWPMPDLSQPPLHTWPREELLAKLRSLTNLRAAPDPTSPTGWKLEIGPFPGWEEVPTW